MLSSARLARAGKVGARHGRSQPIPTSYGPAQPNHRPQGTEDGQGGGVCAGFSFGRRSSSDGFSFTLAVVSLMSLAASLTVLVTWPTSVRTFCALPSIAEHFSITVVIASRLLARALFSEAVS